MVRRDRRGQRPRGLPSPSASDEMFREAYRSVWRVRGPNAGLRGLSLLSTGLERAKTRVDELAVRIRRTRNRHVLDAMYAAVAGTPALRCNPDSSTAVH